MRGCDPHSHGVSCIGRSTFCERAGEPGENDGLPASITDQAVLFPVAAGSEVGACSPTASTREGDAIVGAATFLSTPGRAPRGTPGQTRGDNARDHAQSETRLHVEENSTW